MASSHHSTPKTATDINRTGLLRFVPQALQPLGLLARWDRPIGTYLLLAPAAWGLVFAVQGIPSLYLLVLFCIGAFAMRGAGCTINDILDRNLDAQVARTAARPLPAGLISLQAAWLWLLLQLAIAAIILFLLPPAAWVWAIASIPLVLLYPLMKRITWLPQAWLGMVFNWGVFVGAASLGAHPTQPAILMYLGALFWTVGYDTIYAVQDVDDDAKLGVKSSARLFGAQVRSAVAYCYMVAVALWALAGNGAGLSAFYFAGLAVAAALFVYQFKLWANQGPRAAFIHNQWVGLALFVALAAGYAAA